MLRRIVVALIGLLAVVNGSKWLIDGKRLPTLELADVARNLEANRELLGLLLEPRSLKKHLVNTACVSASMRRKIFCK